MIKMMRGAGQYRDSLFFASSPNIAPEPDPLRNQGPSTKDKDYLLSRSDLPLPQSAATCRPIIPNPIPKVTQNNCQTYHSLHSLY
jgi:hypothetical protein